MKPTLPILFAFTFLISPLRAGDNIPPAGFTTLFNGKNLDGWFGWAHRDPRDLIAMTPDQLADYKKQSIEGGPLAKQTDAKTGQTSEEQVTAHWKVEGGELINDGHGLYLTTDRDYGDIELFIEYKMLPGGDSGIYLRGVPQVQILGSRFARSP